MFTAYLNILLLPEARWNGSFWPIFYLTLCGVGLLPALRFYGFIEVLHLQSWPTVKDRRCVLISVVDLTTTLKANLNRHSKNIRLRFFLPHFQAGHFHARFQKYGFVCLMHLAPHPGQHFRLLILYLHCSLVMPNFLNPTMWIIRHSIKRLVCHQASIFVVAFSLCCVPCRCTTLALALP